MPNPEHLARIKAGVRQWNQWRDDNPEIHLELGDADLNEEDLGNAKLAGAILIDAKLRSTNLSGADLRGADLNGANLSGANLNGANLFGANFVGANLSMAHLVGANLSRAHLGHANLRGAYLMGADMTGAGLLSTIFAGTDFRHIKGLDLCRHYGPSTVGIDAIVESKGEIPEGFLRCCGVPEQIIAYARSLVLEPIQFYSCFISYSNKDLEFAVRVNSDLRAQNLRSWFADEDLKIGDRFQDSIE